MLPAECSGLRLRRWQLSNFVNDKNASSDVRRVHDLVGCRNSSVSVDFQAVSQKGLGMGESRTPSGLRRKLSCRRAKYAIGGRTLPGLGKWPQRQLGGLRGWKPWKAWQTNYLLLLPLSSHGNSNSNSRNNRKRTSPANACNALEPRQCGGLGKPQDLHHPFAAEP